MSSQFRPILILVVASLPVVAGCNPVAWIAEMRAPEVYVPADSVAELRGPHKIKVWATVDGKRVRGVVNAHDRWLIGPPASVIPEGKTDGPELRESGEKKLAGR